MVKGTRFFILILLLCVSFTSFASTTVTNHDQETMDLCVRQTGRQPTLTPIPGTDPDGEIKRQGELSDGSGRYVERELCQYATCIRASADIDVVRANDIAQTNAELEAAGSTSSSAVYVRRRVCSTVRSETRTSTVRTDDDQRNRRGDGGSSGDDRNSRGGVTVEVNGRRYTCRGTSDPEECLRIKGLDIDLDGFTIVFDGRGSDGRSRYVVRRGNSDDVDRRVGRDIDQGRNGRDIRFVNGRLIINGRGFDCAPSESESACLRRLERDGIIRRSGRGSYEVDVDCAHCGFRVTTRERRSSGLGGVLSGIAEIGGAIAPPLFGYLGVKAQANAYRDANTAWAGAAATGFEQCQIMQTGYVQNTYSYLSSNELPDREVLPPECNGYQLGGFAGTGGLFGNGFGNGFGNVWTGGGYSPQFLAAVQGPAGGFNPYLGITGFGPGFGGGFPGLGGGINIGIGGGLGGGGFGPGFGGGFGPGFGGGLNTGFNTGLGGGFGPGFGGGIGGGFGPGFGVGLGGGIPGFGGGAFTPGMGYNPGFGGGFGGGFGPGFGGGINVGIGGGLGGGGFNNGFGGGFGGGFNPGFGGGATGWGGVPFPSNGGSYWNGTGGWNGGAGGNVNGNGWFSVQNAQSANGQAFQAGSVNQQIALQNQAGAAAFNTQYGGGGGFGYAPFAPGNVGFGLSGGFGFGGGRWP